MKLMPGSPFNDAKLSPEQKQILAEKYGLNDPVGVQYLNYLKNVISGDFGNSFQYHNQPVWDLISPKLIPSLEMGLIAVMIGIVLGSFLSVIAAVKQNTWIDYLATTVSVIAVSVPSFVLAVLLQNVFFSSIKMVSSCWVGRTTYNSFTIFVSISYRYGYCFEVYQI